MAFAPQPFVEQPNLRTSIALIVDDGVPCLNPLWYFRHQVDGQEHPNHVHDIPVSFMEEWCRWVSDSGVRGDFTILPYPAGLGRIDQALTGYDSGELRAWLNLAQKAVTPQFDIHAEILTHTHALDLKTRQLLPISEHEWTEAQDEKALTNYFAAALQILGEAGLPAHGLTQPCFYRGDESLYARALLDAEKRVNNRHVTHNFLHMDSVSSRVPPRVTYLDADAGEAVVSHWAGTDDYLWNAQDPAHDDHLLPPEALADRFLTADGQAGRLMELIPGGGPLVMVTHWQSLYSNGSGLGLKTFQEVAARVASVSGSRVAWRKLSEITAQHLAATTAYLTAAANANTMFLDAISPFSADILTISVPTPWPLYKAPEVSLDGQVLAQVSEASQLQALRWLMRGSLVTLSFPVTARQSRHITIRSLP